MVNIRTNDEDNFGGGSGVALININPSGTSNGDEIILMGAGWSDFKTGGDPGELSNHW